jgi:hypothetical protein
LITDPAPGYNLLAASLHNYYILFYFISYLLSSISVPFRISPISYILCLIFFALSYLFSPISFLLFSFSHFLTHIPYLLYTICNLCISFLLSHISVTFLNVAFFSILSLIFYPFILFTSCFSLYITIPFLLSSIFYLPSPFP